MSKARGTPLRAYGDRQGDGMVQMSFVLELPPGALAKEAAKRFAEAHGLQEPLVSTMEECAVGFSFFVVYGHSTHSVDTSKIEVAEIQSTTKTRDEIAKAGSSARRREEGLFQLSVR